MFASTTRFGLTQALAIRKENVATLAQNIQHQTDLPPLSRTS